jgi:hypothetical protein
MLQALRKFNHTPDNIPDCNSFLSPGEMETSQLANQLSAS